MLPRQPAWRMTSVGQLRVLEQPGLEERRQRTLLDGDLLAREEEVAGRNTGAGELEHHRDPAFHVARAEPVHCTVVDPPGQISLRGDRVHVAGENDGRS